MISKFVALAAATLIASPALAQAGDAAKGKAVFARCMACHTVDPGVNRLGPSLAGVVGRTSGTVPGFAYSAAMKNAKIRWDAKSLDAFLAKPTAKVPGSKMIFAGLPNPADRANLIAYLATAGKK
ncbi:MULTISPECIES: cytochrome c family protein [Sphingobium]|jgi:cytochrome c|uniref:Cytochrome c n=2 Tax=Sphingobium fuliginis (strain ATCC 27551) TaxID=336203 RepID=A0A292ZED2_SPHSA|nr:MULTISPECIES: cytochrome c family protein [Sphingobium]OAP31353.1 cytochrome C [Sphingobium sp. 20006FA]AJR24972.1 cytochrome C [Sphingobium sp. YBL2]KXU32075.1 cytochrome C [Sphingobium sp. AM]KYC31830.1 cytochrome C [Sphingobium sp. 22B]MCB4860205.1 cytochrome c family protein [Sphingobium sp. PNB]